MKNFDILMALEGRRMTTGPSISDFGHGSLLLRTASLAEMTAALLSSIGALARREELEFFVASVVERSYLVAAQGAFSFSHSSSIHFPSSSEPTSGDRNSRRHDGRGW